MNKKSILTAAVSLSLIAVVGVGATLAYFSDSTGTAKNVFTTGLVNIELVDETDSDAAMTGQVPGVPNEEGGVTYTDVMPGDNLSKIVGATILDDSQPCWLGFKVSVSSTSPLKETVEQEVVNLVWDSVQKTAQTDPNWIVSVEGNDLYCYRTVETVYNEEDPVANRVLLFNGIQIPGAEWDNRFAGANFEIDVKAAAVQTANLPAPSFEGNETNTELYNLLNNG